MAEAVLEREGVFWIALRGTSGGATARITWTLDVQSPIEEHLSASTLQAAVGALESWWRQCEALLSEAP